MLQIAVCDDNLDELAKMAQLINQYCTTGNIDCGYTAFTNGFELVSALETGKRFDIYCLDIMMPGFTGIEVAREIRNFDRTAPLIFFTSSPEFALESYSVKAINYVLKPVTREKLFYTLDDVMEKVNREADEDALIVKSEEGIQRILISGLTHTEASGRNVLYHLRSGRVIRCLEPFSAACERLLKYGCFIRPHRSYLVNMQFVDTIRNRQITLQTRSVVPVAQGRARDIRQQYLNYQMEGE